VISVEKEGVISTGLFRGASPLHNYTGTFGYVLRVSGQDEGQDEKVVRVNMTSIADGSIKVWLNKNKKLCD
jgi:hypothetical protein